MITPYVAHRNTVQDAAFNIRERIICSIPGAYGAIKEKTPIYDIIQAISEELAEVQSRQAQEAYRFQEFVNFFTGREVAEMEDVRSATQLPIDTSELQEQIARMFDKHKDELINLVTNKVKNMEEEERAGFMAELAAL